MRSDRLYIRFSIAIGLCLLSSCSLFGSKGDTSSGSALHSIDFARFSQAPPLVVGRWQWKKSVYPQFGDGPAVRTPSNTDRTETLVFSSPDTVHVYRSDTLDQRTSREAVLDGTNWGVHEDTLATSTVFRDGPLKIYERVE